MNSTMAEQKPMADTNRIAAQWKLDTGMSETWYFREWIPQKTVASASQP